MKEMRKRNHLQPKPCPVCQKSNGEIFLEMAEVPVHCNLLWSAKADAVDAPRGSIQLTFCPDCGFIFNAAFDPELMEYSQTYENSLHFSPRFQNYAESLAKDLINRHKLKGKQIIDIGCGKGDFLKLLCKLGGNTGVGFDPSYEPELNKIGEEEKKITFVQDFYSEVYSDYQADLICCRHVLEHIQFPRNFLSVVRRAIGNRVATGVLFEVPNVIFTLRDLGIWDIIYEHCNYFSRFSLHHLFSACEFERIATKETFNEQFITLEAFPASSRHDCDEVNADGIEEVAGLVDAFGEKYRLKVEEWSEFLTRAATKGQRLVVWGSGSKGVTFLNTLQTHNQIEYVVDINPRKQGNYVAGTGQKIVPPEFLLEYQPDVIVIMNSVYKSEIKELCKQLGLSAEMRCA